eukprot:scaffold304561_cov31-Tisochrysis_lutea.AAC.1
MCSSGSTCAPACKRARAEARHPEAAAAWSGVIPDASAACEFAPRSSNSAVTSGARASHARCKARDSRLVVLSTFALASRRRRAASNEPPRHAQCKAVAPVASTSCTLAPAASKTSAARGRPRSHAQWRGVFPERSPWSNGLAPAASKALAALVAPAPAAR